MIGGRPFSFGALPESWVALPSMLYSATVTAPTGGGAIA